MVRVTVLATEEKRSSYFFTTTYFIINIQSANATYKIF